MTFESAPKKLRQFEWRTEDDGDWPNEPPRLPAKHPSGRRRLGILLLAILLAGAGAYVIQREVTTAVQVTTDAMALDVLAAMAVVDRMAQTPDPDLLNGVLSGGDPAWTAVQRQRAAGGILRDQPYLGLTLVAAAPLTITHVQFSSDLQQAMVNAPALYAIGRGDDPRLASLTVPYTFRRGSNRWLLSPPTDEAWGAWRTLELSRLTISYPARDEESVVAMAPIIDRIARRACAALYCPVKERLQLRFSTDPALLLALNDPNRYFQRPGVASVPSPSLLGIPTTDDAIEDLGELYAILLVNSALVDASCCDNGLVVQALRDLLLDRLYVQAYPLSESKRNRLLHDPGVPQISDEAWQLPPDPSRRGEDWKHVYAVAAFALEDASVDDILITLASLGPNSEPAAIYAAADGRADTDLDAWYRFLSGPPGTLGSDVGLLCRHIDSPGPFRSLLYRYESGSGALVLEERFAGDVHGVAVDDGRSLLLSERTSNRMFESRLLLWRPAGLTTVVDPDRGDMMATFTRAVDPTGRLLVLARPDAPTSAISSRSYLLLDVDDCAGERCALQPLVRYPFWSPTGSSTLGFDYAPDGTARVWRGNATGGEATPLIDGVQWAFWLDAGTIGVVTEEGLFELGTDGEEQLPIVALTALRGALTNAGVQLGESAVVMDVVVSPAAPGQLFVHLFDPGALRHVIARVARHGKIITLATTSTGRWIELALSADGRWLAVWGPEPAGGQQLSLVSVTQAEETRHVSLPTGAFDWSPTGARIVTPLGDAIRVTDVGSYETTVYPLQESLSCWQSFWLADASAASSPADRPALNGS